MPYALSLRSRARLYGVQPDLVAVVRDAITRSTVDFAVGEGLRSMARQRQLFAAGASRTMDSRHITGHAVDLVALVGGAVRWELDLYRRIAEAMRDAADALRVELVWGACWRPVNREPDLSALVGDYVAAARAQGRRPLVDGPHFELSRARYPAGSPP